MSGDKNTISIDTIEMEIFTPTQNASLGCPVEFRDSCISDAAKYGSHCLSSKGNVTGVSIYIIAVKTTFNRRVKKAKHIVVHKIYSIQGKLFREFLPVWYT